MSVSRAISRSQRGVWLLTIDVGRPLHFATRAVTIPRDRGDVIEAQSGLGDFSLGSSLGAEVSLGFTIDATVPVRAEPISWAKLVAQGVVLEERPAILRRWFPGQTLEQAQVWLVGRTYSAEYGDPRAYAGRLAISVRRRPTLGKPVPLSQESLTNDTWPVRAFPVILPEQMQGASYPIVIGAPGTQADGASIGGLAVVPAPMAEHASFGLTSKLVVSRGRVQAQSVVLWDTNNPLIVSAILPVVVEKDKLGQEVSLVDVTGSTLAPAVAGGKYYTGWQADNGAIFGGGVVDPVSGRLVRGAVDVITYLLEQNGTQVDRGRMGALIPLLNTYLIDVHINSPVVAFDFLRTEILPLLPVVERQGEHGLYYDIERWEARPTEAVYTLDADRRVVAASAGIGLRQQADTYNEFTIEYGLFAATGRYTRRLTITAQDGFLSESTPLSSISGVLVQNSAILANLKCALSQTRLGEVRPAPPIQAKAIWDPATALKILQDRANRDALPKRVTQYTGGPELEFLSAYEGRICLVKDTERGLVNAVARIDNVEVGGPSAITVVDVTLIDDLTQLQRLT